MTTRSASATPKLPDDFPSDEVPLPESGELKAVVSGKQKGDQYFSLTYSVHGGDLKSAAKDYKQALEDDGYTIESSSSIGGSSGSFSAFTAVGTDWDVIVYSGGYRTRTARCRSRSPTHDPKQDVSRLLVAVRGSRRPRGRGRAAARARRPRHAPVGG